LSIICMQCIVNGPIILTLLWAGHCLQIGDKIGFQKMLNISPTAYCREVVFGGFNNWHMDLK
jgi:hypothetical protein